MSTTISLEYAESRVPQTPERRLWAVCLLDGVREGLHQRHLRLKVETKSPVPVESMHWPERWLMDTTWSHVGSFVWICEQLGYDPDHMRAQALANAREILKK